MAVKRRCGFTLVELLVVISIIVILMSILLPALKKVRIIVGVGVCAKQLRTTNDAFHAYINEYYEKLPFTSSCANMSTYHPADGCNRQLSGFGLLLEDNLIEIEDYRTFFCPTTKTLWGPPEIRQQTIDNFPANFEERNWINCEYVIGYWVMEYWGPWPREIGPPKDTLENYKKARVAWTADCSPAFWFNHHGLAPHSNHTYMNVGMVDGSVRAIFEYREQLPQKGVYGYYWPHNDRPKWGWWEYFGAGEGL